MSTLNLEIDSSLQKQAEETFSRIGLPVSEAINIFLKAAVRYGGLPFENKLECYNDETKAAIEEVERGEGLSRPFTSIDDLIKDLMDDA